MEATTNKRNTTPAAQKEDPHLQQRSVFDQDPSIDYIINQRIYLKRFESDLPNLITMKDNIENGLDLTYTSDEMAEAIDLCKLKIKEISNFLKQVDPDTEYPIPDAKIINCLSEFFKWLTGWNSSKHQKTKRV